MTDAELKAAIAQAERRSHEVHRLLAKTDATVAELADVDRQLHVEIDRKHKAIADAKGDHAAALKRIVEILSDDVKATRAKLKAKRELKQKRIHIAAHTTAHLHRLRKRWANRHAPHNGFLVGTYHFARPDVNSAQAEAQHYVQANRAAGVRFVALDDWLDGANGFLGNLDFEHAPYSESWAREFGDEFANLTDVKAGLYGGGYSIDPVLGALSHFAGVWIAGYPNYAWGGPASALFAHQFTSSSYVAGEGPVDRSHLLRSPGGDFIDTSVYQGDVDVKLVASQLRGWIFKATEGVSYTDPTFTKGRVDAALAAG